MRSGGLRLLPFLAGLGLFCAGAAAEPVPPPAAPGSFYVIPVAEKTVSRLPDGPLFWRVESMPSITAARAAAGPFSLAVETAGTVWLITLGAAGGSTADATLAAEIGPLPAVRAHRYLLRVNHAGGPPGSSTPVHTHPGSESFFVLKGQLSQQAPTGVMRVGAGHAMSGHEPGMIMQLRSSGQTDLEQLVMFVVDADKPFSSPASFER